jgi:alanyl-tRNA synthetase
MRANELRRAFQDFFAARAHTVVPSASLIPHDPTVLFTVAGMVPFKPYFVGEEPAPWPRAVSVQKCVRAGGKHNDLDQVGRTSRHLTFFEMLGNFSFGDYFKETAIPLAWELITDVLGLDQDRLWVTVHTSDDEAEKIWRDLVGVAPDRIQRLDEDNFWRMGEVGPCGPSSEIFWDKGPEHGAEGGPAHGGDERFVEIWNLVFMQYEQHADGTMTPLPKPSIDTGAGLERVLSVVQGVESIWEIDEMRHLISVAEGLCATRYGTGEPSDVSLRIVAEHARTMTFLISDGVFPSNEDRGYVLRRIIRRSIRHAYLLGVEAVVLPSMVDAVVATMADDYPELAASHTYVREVVEREEVRFRETLRTGSLILTEALDEVAAMGSGARLAGSVAFQLHDTYGFPLEVTEEVAAERGIAVDRVAFDDEMAAQRQRGRDARKAVGRHADASTFATLLESDGPTEFTGREEDSSAATVLAVLDDSIVLDRTPFYAESGGQVGDTGVIETATGRASVIDTVYGVPGLTRHVIGELTGEILDGQEAKATIDTERRAAIRRNHTATHILHWALRHVLGDHVKQQGSLVAPDRLRFDFSHYAALTHDEIRRIEDLANAEILSNAPVRHYETTKDHAASLGAIAFFGDKYGDLVRVLEAGDHSIELCGGTHVGALGDIGPLKIVSEGSIGSNIRRIEAVTGTGPIERLREREALLSAAAERLGVPSDDLVEGIEKRTVELKSLRDEVKALRRQVAAASAGSLVDDAVDGVVVARVDAETRDEVRDLAMSLRDRPGMRAVVLGASPGGKGVALVAAVQPGGDLNAGDLISDAIKVVGGGGGKGADLASAGGKDPSRLDEALDLVRSALGVPAA